MSAKSSSSGGDSLCTRELERCQLVRAGALDELELWALPAQLSECWWVRRSYCTTYDTMALDQMYPQPGQGNPAWEPRFACTAEEATCEAFAKRLAENARVRRVDGCKAVD